MVATSALAEVAAVEDADGAAAEVAAAPPVVAVAPVVDVAPVVEVADVTLVDEASVEDVASDEELTVAALDVASTVEDADDEATCTVVVAAA